MAPTTLLFFLLPLFFIPTSATTHFQPNQEEGYISMFISQKGLNFTKDILIKEAIASLTPLELPQIEKFVKIPLIGSVDVVLSNITIDKIDVSESYVKPGGKGVEIVASGATANLSMNWRYSYTTWVIVPIQISDKGRAFIKVEGLEVGLTLDMKNQGGSLKLSVVECSCNVKSISIHLDGGASWFYQGLANAFEGQIISTTEKSISKKIKEGVLKLDSSLQTVPKEIPVDDIASMNVTFVNDPLLGSSSIGFEINGLFIAIDNGTVPSYDLGNLQSSNICKGPLKMLGMSLDEAVFNSGSTVYFDAGILHWIVSKVPEQSLLNTAGWRYLVPALYRKYPNDDMQLNVTLSSPPFIKVSPDKIESTIYTDMTIDVVDANEIVPVACISVVIRASGSVEISKNKLVGYVGLDDFTLSLKWSNIGNFHMSLIQATMWTFLKTVAIPYANSRLRNGFPLPIVSGFNLQNAEIVYTNSRVVICSDVAYTNSYTDKLISSS